LSFGTIQALAAPASSSEIVGTSRPNRFIGRSVPTL
jgi:hypothetical protein